MKRLLFLLYTLLIAVSLLFTAGNVQALPHAYSSATIEDLSIYFEDNNTTIIDYGYEASASAAIPPSLSGSDSETSGVVPMHASVTITDANNYADGYGGTDADATSLAYAFVDAEDSSASASSSSWQWLHVSTVGNVTVEFDSYDLWIGLLTDSPGDYAYGYANAWISIYDVGLGQTVADHDVSFTKAVMDGSSFYDSFTGSLSASAFVDGEAYINMWVLSSSDVIDVVGAPVPEPATMLLLGLGLVGLAGFSRRKKFFKK